MSKFIYRMQSILNLKYKLEEQVKMEFAAARMRLDEEEEKLRCLFERKASYEEEGRRLRGHNLNVQDILDNKNAILQMGDYIVNQKIEVRRAEDELERKRQKLQEIMQERKVQEKLREKAFEEFMKEENSAESKEVDELTSYTYGRRRR
ncbi:flagellar FliJ protein [Kineothrix alysoides]|uniref:Flagellar FliJ protein n=1 Tax=Kineothrix alysoides TaxID=1469948 RepID=A0A4R1QXK0_9FIRM|nr:flagellar export protein FliJ [Kineothrix alysoides]TCL56594.1 flagellar FliJ protein [Kineothrix alysoides]